jgi:hypothetical protein
MDEGYVAFFVLHLELSISFKLKVTKLKLMKPELDNSSVAIYFIFTPLDSKKD